MSISTIFFDAAKRWPSSRQAAAAVALATVVGIEPTIATELQAPSLFLPATASAGQGKSLQSARLNDIAKLPVIFNRAALDLPIHSEVAFALPDGTTRTLVYERQIRAASGNVTWVGYDKDHGPDWRAIVTVGADTAVGTISTPDGGLKIEPDQGMSWVYDIARSGVMKSAPFADDGIAPPVLERRREEMASEQTAAADPASNTVIDVLVLYTDTFAEAYPGSALQTRIDHLFALANQAYADSQISLTIRLVGSQKISYNANVDLRTSLNSLTKGAAPFSGAGPFDGVAALRDSVGADLVTLLMPFNRASQTDCGVAWLNGSGGTTLNPTYGYSVVSDGYDTDGNPYYCTDYTLAHELGHSMGSAHDREHSTAPGAYPYSYGYGIDGSFGTIMSYYRPTVGKFSSPRIGCETTFPVAQPRACGIDQSLANSADNATSINKTKDMIAAFRTTVIPLPVACNKVAVYRFRNTVVPGHYYTTSIADGQARAAAGEPLVYEGVAMTACSNEDPSSGRYAVHKFKHLKHPGVYFYSMVPAEVDDVKQNLTSLLTYDGIAFYASNYQTTGSYPVLRFRNTKIAGSNFYTIDPGEKDTIVQSLPVFSIENVGFYAFPPGS